MNKTIKYPNNRLKELRKARGLVQGQVAIHLGRQCEDRICRWEQGTSAPNLENLFHLAAIYEVYPHELYPELFAEIQQVHQVPQKTGPIV